VSAATDGQDAIEVIAEAGDTDPFDLILLDMQMPVRDGYETARALREGGYRGSIIALTAAAARGDRERCLQSGCDDHIAKPIERTELLSRLSGLGAAATAERSAPTSRTERPPRRVLLVEDDEDTRVALSRLLERRARLDVRAAGSGTEALEIAASVDWTPQVVLLDLTLPDLDGFEVLAALREMPSLDGTLLVALTGRTEPEVLERAMRSGIHEIVRKPVHDIGELTKLIFREGGIGEGESGPRP
jgi:CheY-like chemotaxis protein